MLGRAAVEKEKINLSQNELVRAALEKNEGILSQNGALVVTTGKRTGRSPKDRFIVQDQRTQQAIDWGEINRPIANEAFQALWAKANAYLQDKQVYTNELQIGAASQYALPVRVTTELAWHNLFCCHLFISPRDPALSDQEEWNILNAAGLTTDPDIDGVNGDGALIINFQERKVLLCGMLYAGEMKKAMFTVLNFLLPERDVLPMHCAANVGEKGDTALFFGLSGTGKTTLSADPGRFLIGDDEHGWGPREVFNFEGGCYAKCIDLSQEREPVIYNAIRDGAIMENVVLNDRGEPDYSDDSLTQNTRAGYPRQHIPKRVEQNQAGLPKTILFLTCDLYGVLPPVSLLSTEQAAYYFLSGYTALVGSTEVGSTAGIQPTFSTCFGAPFFPRPATVYADLLMRKIQGTGAQVYLVNTGWTGGAYGEGGKRFAIPVTRRIVSAAIGSELLDVATTSYPGFGVQVPVAVKGIDSDLLDPQRVWQDAASYRQTMNALITQFKQNFERFDVSDVVVNAGPNLLE